MEDAEHKIFVNDVNIINFQEHTYCQVQGESRQNGRNVQHVSIGVQTVGEGELLTENPENNSNAGNRSNLNKTIQTVVMDNYPSKIIGTESNTSDKNIFQNIGDFCPDGEEGDCVGDLQNITLNWPPIVHRRKSHKSYLATWSAQISCDGFAKCLIETCNFISLDLQTMQDHYKTCNGIPNYDLNSCGSCSCWLPTGNELAMHETSCKGKKRDSSITLLNLKDLNEAETNQSEIEDGNHIICASPQTTSCISLSVENSEEMPNERQMKYCDECDIEFLSDTDFSQHLICKKNSPETLPVTEKNREATSPVTDTSQENDVDENNHIVQPGRPIFQGEYVRRRSFTKQHKIVWETAIQNHKYVKCLFQNCHFLGLSVEDMIYHYGYCNGDGTFAKFVCHFCGGRLTRKDLLDIHVRRSHANERIDENKLLSTDTQNEDSRQPTVSYNNELSVSDPICFGGFDPDFPLEAPLEVEITEESSLDCQDKLSLEDSIILEEVKTSDGQRQNKKSNKHSKSQKWGTVFGGSRHSTGGNNSRDSVAGVLNSLEEDNFEHSMVNPSQANAWKNQQHLEVYTDRDFRDDHIYSKVKIRTVSHTESRDSLSVRKKKNLKHYPSKKRVKTENVRVKGEETVPEKKSDSGKEVKEESQLNKTVSDSDASGQNARKMSVTPIPASQGILKRDLLPHYTGIWTDSLKTNGFARCLVATCNFISLDILHVQNHFKNCNGVPEKGPNLCTFCESRLPSSVELEIHTTKCKANEEANSSSTSTTQSSGECKTDSVPKNSTGESSNDGEMENREELKENENKTREESDSFKSNKVAAVGELSSKKEITNFLRIGEIMKLKNKEIVDYNRIIQPGPILPEGHYLRRRSYSRTHKSAWEAALEKHKYVKCLFQNCHFLAMCLEDMIYHFGYCIGDGSFAKFECPHCGGRLTSKVVLDIHIQRSHSDKLSKENDQMSNEEGTEVLLFTLDDWKKLMAKKKLRTYGKNAPRLSIVVVEPDKPKATGKPSEETRDKSSSPDDPPSPKRKCRNPTGSEEVGESSDVNNSISEFNNNACDSSADNKTHTNNDNNNSSGSQTSRPRNPREELRSDEGGDEETQENTDNSTKSIRTTATAKTEDLLEMPGEGDVVKDTSDDQEKPHSTLNSKKNTKITSGKTNSSNPEKPVQERKSSKGDPGTSKKPVDKRRHSHENTGSREKLTDETKTSKGNPLTSEIPTDEQKRSQGNPRTPKKPTDQLKSTKRNPSSSEKPNAQRKHSHGNPGSPEKTTDERKSSEGNLGIPEKLNDEKTRKHGNPKTPEKPNDEQERSQGNPSTLKKPTDERKDSHGNPGSPEKPIDERRRSHGNPGSPERPNNQRKDSHGNPGSPEKPIDERRRSHGNAGNPEKPKDERKSTKGNQSSPEKPTVERRRSHGNPSSPEKPKDERKSTKGNPSSPEKAIDEQRRSHGNPGNPEKPKDERKSTKGNPSSPEKAIDERRRSHGNPGSPEKPNDQRKSKEHPGTSEKRIDERRRSHGNPSSPEKPNSQRKDSHGNPGSPEKPIDERRRSHGNPGSPEKPKDDRKSKEHPGTSEKPTDERRRSHGNPSSPEKPNSQRKDSHGNPGSPEKPIDERRRSHGNPGNPEKPKDERKSTKGNLGIPKKLNDEQRRKHGNPGSHEKPKDDRKSKEHPGTSEKPTDERRRSHGNPSSPEKPNSQRKDSHGNPGTSEKPTDERRRSHGNPGSPEKPKDERKSTKGNPSSPEKPIDERRRSHGNPGSPEKPTDQRKSSEGNLGIPKKLNDEQRRKHGNPGSHEKPIDQRRSSKEHPGTSEKLIDERRGSHGNPRNPSSSEKPNEERKPTKGNSGSPEKLIDERKRSQGNLGSSEKANDERKPTKGNRGSPEKLIDKRTSTKENPGTSESPVDQRKRLRRNPRSTEKPIDERKRSNENPGIPEKPIDQRKRLQRNPKTPGKAIELKSSKGDLDSTEKAIDEQRRIHGDPKIPEKPNDEQKPSHGNTNTSSLVLEKNSNTEKQETEKERKSVRQCTKTENKNSNKNDQETKHDIRPRRKRGRSSKSIIQEDLSEEENVNKVLDDSGAELTFHEGKDHDGIQKPPAKLAKTEPPKSESIVEETRSPTIRKRGRPPKRTSLRCKVLKVEAKEVMKETPEQVKRGGSAKKRKLGTEENKQSLEKKNKVKCATCDFECERQLFTDHNYKKHAGLSWVEGENPIDLNDEDAVSCNVKQAFRHIKSATCGKCGSVKKSALGFISHVQNCGKSEEEKAALKVNCPHCPARILKYSLPVHLKLYHFDSDGNKSSEEKVSVGELPMKRKSALRAVNKFCEVLSQEDDEEETKKKVQFVVYEKGKSKFPKLPGKTRNLWMKMIKEKKKIPCRRGSCLTESSSVQEARNHHFLCSELPPKSYVCERCDFFTESKSVIQQHVDVHPKVDKDYKLESEEEKSEDEADVKDAEDAESEPPQKKPKTVVVPSEDTALETSLKTRFFTREGLLTVRHMRFCRQSLRMTLESEMEEVKKYSPVFPELRTLASDWIHVKPENATDHFPSLNESISFRINNAKKNSESDWKKMKRFEAEIVEDSAVIFTGGSILSMSWCKYSCLRLSKQDAKQYLAVSSSKKMDKFRNIHEERGDTPCLIQIYNCGKMKIHNDVVEVPELAMGIVHEYGEVWDLAWFPLDGFEHSEDGTYLTRIGLLGAACQDGTIKIWPICDPDELKPKHSPPLYKIQPKVILELEGKADVGCLRLAIGRTGTVVGGYAGGLVAVWNLKTISSPFSKTDEKCSLLKPIVSFQAHKTSITALSMCQNSDRYICTSGLDRFIKFWDLESPGNPFESMQKEVCLDNVWPKHWPLTISTLEDILPSCGKGMIKAVRELYCDKHRSPLALEGTCWSLSFNEWLNILCGCNNNGEVKIRFLRNMFLTDETFRHRIGHLICRTELKFLKDLGQEKMEENVVVEPCKGKSKKNEKKAKQAKQAEENTAVPRTYEEAWKYFGLIFHDPVIEEDFKYKSNEPKTSKKANQCLEDYPITSVNKVCWNPNYKRFTQLAIGHHCGLIRIKPVNDTKCNGDVLRFLAESEDELGRSRLE